MTSPQSPSDRLVLKRVQSDAPASPLVGPLRNCPNDRGVCADGESSSGQCSPAEVRESPGNLARFVENKKTESCFESFVIVHNVAKRHNLGTIARSATAFGVSELILVGRKDFNAFGSHGASLHVQFRHFHTLPEAALYLKAKDVDICGVEIVEGAQAVNNHPFRRSTAFMLGNEGTGLSKKEMEVCDFFVYIPQCGAGTASLNVTVAGSIVLHHFSVWAGFAERKREGHKFVVSERPVRRTPRNVVGDNPDAVKERRRQRADDGQDVWQLWDAVDEDEGNEAHADNDQSTLNNLYK
ncbi:hypothetical protein MPTK1_1g17240 [Marchantia polymorpha subsp. ruderalis]|uniref:tRNA/rRNA methyltransferase SpoU type domain-containing protein n=2 Tax=Marchantia polymorpha TaxID=3197 RepID=A0AAF6AR55_MARPO|nr:hypothetical protein MARPO_0001s0064 [Marchantia polymorpha]BBM98925.1 hypothetical protein Mp_1g17240 [Marchantia polymorpha subsp. ruderalis]|eukprot:PTQ50001.1 hypothetical protein MARPO_0001s0064 [Marchantia polymorpha]